MIGIKDFDMPSCCNSCSHWSFNRDDEPLCDLTYEYIRQFDKRQDDCPLIEAIPKADYENRLKADMVAMLDEISLEIDEMDYASIIDCQKLIREKINALKEPSNDD